jgi:hypothetical protein
VPILLFQQARDEVGEMAERVGDRRFQALPLSRLDGRLPNCGVRQQVTGGGV